MKLSTCFSDTVILKKKKNNEVELKSEVQKKKKKTLEKTNGKCAGDHSSALAHRRNNTVDKRSFGYISLKVLF